jgi:protein-disulfide isomerase
VSRRLCRFPTFSIIMRISSLLHRAGASRAALLLLAAPLACSSTGDAKSASSATASAAKPASPGETVAAQAGSMPADSAAQRAAADSGRIMGAPGAKVWMIIASDFQCPYCKMWHDQSYEALRKDYVDAGRVRMAYVNYPLSMHEQAKPAAEAAMCASAQKKFWEYHTALFQSQDSWTKPGDQSAKFDSLATALGLDGARFRACTQSHVMRAVVEADQDRMQRSGVASTPTFFIGNQRVEGAQPLGVFRAAMDSALASSGR